MKHAKTTQLYSSPNGDTWFLVRDPETGTAFVRHKANIPSGGQVTDIPIAAFLSWPRSPEQEALLSLLGTQVPNAHVMPTDIHLYAPERWVDDALFRPEVQAAFHRLTAQGWTDALRALHPDRGGPIPSTATLSELVDSGLAALEPSTVV